MKSRPSAPPLVVGLPDRFGEARQTDAYHLLRCQQDKAYFIRQFCKILDPVKRAYVPFDLWPAQRAVLSQLENNRKVVILKPRQIGLTWLVLADALWHCLFHPISDVAIFSRAAAQSNDTLARLRQMYLHLPPYMRLEGGEGGNGFSNDNVTRLKWVNGSTVSAHAPFSADMYTLTYAIIDEADHIAPTDLDHLLSSVLPAVERGGRMIMLSRVDKRTANSPFKRVYQEAKANGAASGWHAIFLPANVHPERDQAWYEAKKQESLATTGSLDALYENYPLTDAQALATRSTDKRVPHQWLDAVYKPVAIGDTLEGLQRLPLRGVLALPQCEVFPCPVTGAKYVIGVDPAEGNPNSDDSVASVIDATSGVECALLRGKFEPTTLAHYVADLAMIFSQLENKPPLIVVERNNHGHTVLTRLNDRLAEGTGNYTLYRHSGPNMDNKLGFITNQRSKIELYNRLTDAIRDNLVTIRSSVTRLQVGDVGGETLSAPQGAKDDVAMAYALAVWGMGRALSTWEFALF